MSSNNLHGDISRQQELITTTTIFDVSHNNLTGMGTNIAASPDLEVFITSHNNFKGWLAGDGGFAAFNLRVVKFDGNQVFGGGSGMVFFLLPRLEVFNNSGNFYEKQIASELSFCKNLTHYSSRCDHVGTIPSEVGTLSKLEEFDVGGNGRMNGAIPSELGLLTSLTSLDISGTAITGKVPEGLCVRARTGELNILANCSIVDCCEDQPQ